MCTKVYVSSASSFDSEQCVNFGVLYKGIAYSLSSISVYKIQSKFDIDIFSVLVLILKFHDHLFNMFVIVSKMHIHVLR